MNQGKALRTLQEATERDIDKVYDPLPKRVAAIVLRHAKPGADGRLRLTLLGRMMALMEIERAVAEIEPAVAGVVYRAAVAAERLGGEG